MFPASSAITENPPTLVLSYDRALAEIYRTGDADSTQQKAAEGPLWAASERTTAEDWNMIGYHLDAAYHALDAKPPEAGADLWAVGKHPVQIEAERQFWDVECEASALER